MFEGIELRPPARSARGGPRIAVVGSGIAGLGAAHALRRHAQVTLYESGRHFGGHANTVDVTLDGVTHGVDTGFLVLNERTYPGLLSLFGELDVAIAPSDMSFSVQAPRAGGSRLEWSGSSLASVFCQPANALRPGFWRMLADLLRFNRLATRLAEAGEDRPPEDSLGAFLDRHRFSPEFRDGYLLPMLGCIWSSPVDQMLAFPVATLLRFCHNHGLLQVTGRPQWYTVRGGSRRYVEKIVAGLDDVRLATPVTSVWRGPDGVSVGAADGIETFDALVLATHPDQALGLLQDATAREQSVLGAIRYQPNRAVLHTDAAVLPASRRAWAAWNYESAGPGERRVCLHYLINNLQPLPWRRPVIVSLNPIRPIDPGQVLGEFDYAHPVFDAAALRAQHALAGLQGRGRTWFCGAWTGYGFHEDGLASGQDAARGVLAALGLGRAQRADA